MGPYTLSFDEVDGTRLPEVGGKGANLGELTRAGFPVPPGFCATTAAYREFVQTSGELEALLDSLDRVTHEDLDTIRTMGAGPAISFVGGKSGRLPCLLSTRRELRGGFAARSPCGGIQDRTRHGLRRMASIFSCSFAASASSVPSGSGSTVFSRV